MTQVVTVKLRHDAKPRWFEAEDLKPEIGDHVIVQTERGREMGLVCEEVADATDEQISELSSPLKPVLHVASDEDLDRADELAQKSDEAMSEFRELIKKFKLDMKPVCVEYLFDGDKAVFYFSAEDRVDFREIVRELASRLHLRIDMRQIGVRDEARFIGGISHCGEELCCTRFGGEFKPVSIRMAKEQDLPLNPANISGLCGRLMCCLRYEFEAYKDFKSRAPKKGALIETPLGTAKVVDFNTPAEVITMRLEDGKQVSVPLKEMSCDECAKEKAQADGRTPRPNQVCREALEEHANSAIAMALAGLDRDESADLEDKTAEHHNQRRGKGSHNSHGNSHKRGGGKGHSGSGKASENNGSTSQDKSGDKGSTDRTTDGGTGQQKSSSGHRRRRSRGHGNAGSQNQGNANKRNEQSKKQNEHTEKNNEHKQTHDGAQRHRSNSSKQSGGGSPLPGQHSSGVRAGGNGSGNAKTHNQPKTHNQSQAHGTSHEGGRTPRRRHPASGDKSDKGGGQ